MRLRVIAVGKDRKKLFGAGPGEYEARISRYVPFDLLEIPASKKSEPNAARKEEAEKILSLHAKGGRMVLMEVKGSLLSSEGLADLLAGFMQDGCDVDFVIGGDEGLDQELQSRAEKVVSLGRITLPHQLARVVLLEQIYRAMTIIRGEAYHK